jgi:hypothetical protein
MIFTSQVAIGRALNSSRLDLRAKLEELERNGCFSDQETEAGGLKKSNLTVTPGLQVVDWRKQVSYGNVAMARDRTMRDPSPVLYTSADSEAGGDEEDEERNHESPEPIVSNTQDTDICIDESDDD